MAHRIVSRAAWGAVTPRGQQVRLTLPTPRVWLHHTVTTGVGSAAMRKVQNVAFSRGFEDVSYSFVVDQDGNIFEGRGTGVVGAHTKGDNSHSHAICCIGNFDVDEPSAALIDSVAWLLAHGRSEGWWRPPRIVGHRDAPKAATACPGKNLYARLDEINRKANRYALPNNRLPTKGELSMIGPYVDVYVTSNGGGYWVFVPDGGVFAYGKGPDGKDMPFYGSMGDKSLQAPIVGVKVPASEDGYVLIGGDGGIFAFGSVQFGGRP